MASKSTAAPIGVERIVHVQRGPHDYPALVIPGPAPRKGASLRVSWGDALYDATVHDVIDRDGERLVETSGLTPVVADEDEAAPAAPSDEAPPAP